MKYTMEKDTVLLAVETYNELRDFKKQIEEGKTLVIERSWSSGPYAGSNIIRFFTNNEVYKTFETKNKEHETKIRELERKIEQFGLKEPKEITLHDIKKMSYWEFNKWRK